MKRPLFVAATIAAATLGLLALANRPDTETSTTPKPTVQTAPATATDLNAWHRDHPTGALYVQLDKPVYQPGETAWLKVSLFATRSLTYYPDARSVNCELLDPSGSPVLTKLVGLNKGTGHNDFVIPEDAAGGEYKLRLTCQSLTAERSLMINAYRPPLIKKKLDVIGKAYGPGDTLYAKAEFRRATNEPLTRHLVTLTAQIDGRVATTQSLRTDAEGRLDVSFVLPEDIRTEDAYLTLTTSEGGLTESITRPIPLLLSRLNLDFFPEGGDLVTGLPGRVYFQALKPNGKPARVEGRVVDDQGREICTTASFHHGMGRFSFVPQPERTYRLEVTRPSSVRNVYPLPRAKDRGVTMQTDDDFRSERARLSLRLWSTEPLAAATIVASVREEVVAMAVQDLVIGENTVSLAPTRKQGILRLTVLDNKLNPLAERLIYRAADCDMRVSITPNKDHYMPRDLVTLTIQTSLPNGMPCPADLAIAVVDDRALSFADDKTAHLLTRLYLESELPGEIEEPNFYFDPQEAKAPQALDLLMGTRGWRRFKWEWLADPATYGNVHVPNQLYADIADYRGADVSKIRAGALQLAAADDVVVDAAAVAPPAPQLLAEVAARAVPRPAAAAPANRPVQPAAKKPRDAVATPLRRDQIRINEAQGAILAIEEIPLADADRADRRFRQIAIVREFPKVIYKTRDAEQRTDFRETIAWEPRVTTDSNGRATMTFYLNDSVTSFRVTAEGNAEQGLPGRSEKVIDSRTPMHTALKLPVVVSDGDRIDLPIRVTNETDAPLAITGRIRLPDTLRLTTSNHGFDRFSVDPRDGKTHYLPMTANTAKTPGGELMVEVESAGLIDAVKLPFEVEPVGFPIEHSQSGELVTSKSLTVVLPDDLTPNSLHARVSLYPSPMATVLSGLEAMLREPCGCFEQASSSTYPNIMALSYLQRTGAVDPAIEKRALGLLDRGYAKLTGYECKDNGYEWFGGNPGHEALTAYGLMEFADMAQVYDKVDPEMIKRTASWLLAQRDGVGGFKRNARALDSFGRATPEVTNAYVTWALNAAGVAGLDRERAAVAQQALASDNAYIQALALLAGAQGDTRKSLLASLVANVDKDGACPAPGSSITGSGGQVMTMETTALTILARLHCGQPAAMVKPSVDWLLRQRSGGGFGATQSTILTLKALIAYADASRAVQADGDVFVRVNGVTAGRLHFTKGDQGVISFDNLADYLRPGENVVDLQLQSAQALPFSLDVQFKSPRPASDSACKVRLSTTLADKSLKMGQLTTLDLTLKNVTTEGLPMVLARIGIPAGLSPQLKQLKDLRERGIIDFFETSPREVILYYRGLPANGQKDVRIALQADVPGHYTGIASSAYLYYNKENKHWTNPASITIHTP